MTRGNQRGTSGFNPFRSLKMTVTSENTNTSQQTAAPRKVIRAMALVRISNKKEANQKIGPAIIVKVKMGQNKLKLFTAIVRCLACDCNIMGMTFVNSCSSNFNKFSLLQYFKIFCPA